MRSSFGEGVKSFFSSFAKVLILALVVLAVGFGVVYPLWKWSTSSPVSYTWFMLVLVAGFAVWLLVGAFRKAGAKRFFLVLSKIVILAGGIFLSVMLLLNMHRLWFFVTLAVTFVAFFILHFGTRQK